METDKKALRYDNVLNNPAEIKFLEINEDFYAKYSDKVKSIAANILLPRGKFSQADVEDCAGEVFLKLVQNPERFDSSKGGEETYICVLTRSTALDFFRRRLKNEENTTGEENLDALCIYSESENEAEYNLLVEDIISSLNKKERVFFAMKYLYCFTSEEIGAKLKITRAAVDMRNKRLKEKLVKFLRKAGYRYEK